MPPTQSILPTPRGRRFRQITIAFVAAVALVTVTSTAQARTNHRHSSTMRSAPHHVKKATQPAPSRNAYAGLANYAAGYLTTGNTVPQGGNRYDAGFAGWGDFASGYMAGH